MALHAACYTDGDTSEAKRLARRQYPAAMFSAALAVMDIESGKMLKHRQLINHSDNNTRGTWHKLTANEIERLFQGVGGELKTLLTLVILSQRHRYHPTASRM